MFLYNLANTLINPVTGFNSKIYLHEAKLLNHVLLWKVLIFGTILPYFLCNFKQFIPGESHRHGDNESTYLWLIECSILREPRGVFGDMGGTNS